MIRDEWIENTLLAAWLWSEVPPACVIEGLHDWRCGTQACFGGHLAHWPEFKAKGVRAGLDGRPTMAFVDCAADISHHLFGDASMFAPLHAHRADNDLAYMQHPPEHEVVANRLRANLDLLIEPDHDRDRN